MCCERHKRNASYEPLPSCETFISRCYEMQRETPGTNGGRVWQITELSRGARERRGLDAARRRAVGPTREPPRGPGSALTSPLRAAQGRCGQQQPPSVGRHDARLPGHAAVVGERASQLLDRAVPAPYVSSLGATLTPF